jgi:transposase
MDDLLNLTGKERGLLETIVATSRDTRQLQRAQAMLWLAEGESVATVAHLLRVSRQTIYGWTMRLHKVEAFDLAKRLCDGIRSGRPPTAQGIIDPLIDQIIESDPREAGYASTVWTAGLLQHYLVEQHQVAVSRRSISYALERLEIIWKRPRHTLARRAKFWRQAKGG